VVCRLLYLSRRDSAVCGHSNHVHSAAVEKCHVHQNDITRITNIEHSGRKFRYLVCVYVQNDKAEGGNGEGNDMMGSFVTLLGDEGVWDGKDV
jgi:ribosomal protein S5